MSLLIYSLIILCMNIHEGGRGGLSRVFWAGGGEGTLNDPGDFLLNDR